MPVKEAEDEVEVINYQIDAMMLARDMDIDNFYFIFGFFYRH